jgi:hypothetical protein
VEQVAFGCRSGACGGTIPLSTSDEGQAKLRAAWLREALASTHWQVSSDVDLDVDDDSEQYRVKLTLKDRGSAGGSSSQ